MDINTLERKKHPKAKDHFILLEQIGETRVDPHNPPDWLGNAHTIMMWKQLTTELIDHTNHLFENIRQRRHFQKPTDISISVNLGPKNHTALFQLFVDRIGQGTCQGEEAFVGDLERLDKRLTKLLPKPNPQSRVAQWIVKNNTGHSVWAASAHEALVKTIILTHITTPTKKQMTANIKHHTVIEKDKLDQAQQNALSLWPD